jgi:hypothetical protein
MALVKDDLIVYQDLLDKTLDMIKSKCSNIDAFASGVPSTLKNGTTWTLASGTVGHNVNGSTTNHTLSTTATVSDSLLVTVPASTVKSQLQSFLTSRGIATKPDDIVSFKGIMNYYANISAFLSAKLMFVANSFSSGTFVFYNSSNTNYPSVTAETAGLNYPLSEVKTTLTEVMNSINNVQNVHYANTVLTYNSSCCSCSSSSSSSSSSCSSSSSSFIVYMDI